MSCTPTADSPKILPWLAARAGVAPHRASALWCKARRFADGLARPGTAAWHKLALDYLRVSLAADTERNRRGAALGSLWLLPARLWLAAAESTQRGVLALAVASRGDRRAA